MFKTDVCRTQFFVFTATKNKFSHCKFFQKTTFFTFRDPPRLCGNLLPEIGSFHLEQHALAVDDLVAGPGGCGSGQVASSGGGSHLAAGTYSAAIIAGRPGGGHPTESTRSCCSEGSDTEGRQRGYLCGGCSTKSAISKPTWRSKCCPILSRLELYHVLAPNGMIYIRVLPINQPWINARKGAVSVGAWSHAF